MKAIVVREPGGPEQLELAEVPDPKPGPGEILLDVHATALNRADLLQRRGLYPPPPGATEVLGLECSGVVSAHGPNVSSPELGTRVMALLPGGGYAERVTIPSGMAMPIPDAMSFEDAAAVPEAFLTSHEALVSLGRVSQGELVLIHAAAGGVGSAAVQLAHVCGAQVVATAGSAEKLARVKALGADHLVNYKEQDFVQAVEAASGGHGADVILDFVGGSYWDKHAQCLAVGGRVVVIGLLGGASAKVSLAQLLMRRYQILGLVMRSRSVEDKVAITRAFSRSYLELLADGRLRPVVDRVLPLANAKTAHEYMETNANVGKIVLRVR